MSAAESVPQGRASISAIVVCYNEEERIGRCLESLTWCDEIVVVDAFSTDRTVEICRRYTDKVVQRAWKGYREQKAFAHSLATRDWVFLVDSDERVTPELRAEILAALAAQDERCAGYAVPRLVYYLGRWWWRGGWYPDYDVRLFRRERATWGGSDPHERILVDGSVRRLKNPLEHFSYRNMEDHIQRINRFTSISSAELKKEGARWRWSAALFHPLGRFLRFYFLKRGFLEGFAGFYVAVSAAFYVFLKYAKLWELQAKEKEKIERR